jgi:hypothetical protein
VGALLPLSPDPDTLASAIPAIAVGAKDLAEYQEHAHGLGAGPAGLLGFAESAIRTVSCGVA